MGDETVRYPWLSKIPEDTWQYVAAHVDLELAKLRAAAAPLPGVSAQPEYGPPSPSRPTAPTTGSAIPLSIVGRSIPPATPASRNRAKAFARGEPEMMVREAYETLHPESATGLRIVETIKTLHGRDMASSTAYRAITKLEESGFLRRVGTTAAFALAESAGGKTGTNG